MRVISGKVRGLRLDSPDGVTTRPTLDRVKEAVFSMLMPYLCDATVLDLFAGSGALGIEALSRGAKSAVFIDSSSKAIACIEENIKRANFDSVSAVKKYEFDLFLESCDAKFDIIFLDPPYEKGFYDKALRIISERSLLSDNGLIVAEWDYEIGFTNKFYDLALIKEKKYGRVGISVLGRGI